MYSSALKNIKFKFSIICSTSFVENSGDWTMKINGCRRVCWMPHCTFQLNLWQLGAIAIWKSRRRWCYSVLTLMNGSNWEWIQTLEWIRTETPHPRIPPLTSTELIKTSGVPITQVFVRQFQDLIVISVYRLSLCCGPGQTCWLACLCSAWSASVHQDPQGSE